MSQTIENSDRPAASDFVDLSGIATENFRNPYDALLVACKDVPESIQSRYALHRITRNSQQKAKMLDMSFNGVNIDQILLRLEDPTIEPGYTDPRHCLVFWARPTQKVKDLISQVQQELLTVAPNLWTMPLDNLHLTALEITHSRTKEEIEQIVREHHERIPLITEYTFTHRARLIKPMIGFDASALALSFVPAAGEGLGESRSLDDDKYSYHHLRRDLYNECSNAGFNVDSRYVVPSSHLTIGRFIRSVDFEDDKGANDAKRISRLIAKIEEINDWLQKEYWPEYNDGKIKDGGEWVVGEGKGLDCRMGTLWYGNGDMVHIGKGF